MTETLQNLDKLIKDHKNAQSSIHGEEVFVKYEGLSKDNKIILSSWIKNPDDSLLQIDTKEIYTGLLIIADYFDLI